MATGLTTKISLLIAGLLTIAASLSCSRPSSRDYADFITIDSRGWAYGDTLRFIPAATDSVINGPLILSVCHDDDYLYSNLWVEVTYRCNDKSRTLHRDTINMPLANRYGQWYGQGFGATFQASDTVADNFKIVRGDTILLRHVMRIDTLHNISQIGFSIYNNTH